MTTLNTLLLNLRFEGEHPSLNIIIGYMKLAGQCHNSYIILTSRVM